MKRYGKKLLAVGLSLAMTMSFTACGNTSNGTSAENGTEKEKKRLHSFLTGHQIRTTQVSM